MARIINRKEQEALAPFPLEANMRRLGTLIENAIVDRQEKYMRLRIEQLKEDMEKAHDEHDKKWYNRCIQELNWALQMKGKPDHNCYMAEANKESSRW